MTELNLNFSFKARYYKLAEITSQTKKVWVVLHGYGQLAQFFIRKFQPFANEQTCIIAPEGLSRFYLAEDKGRVGATWMTKENRLTDIENYLNFLNSILEQELAGRDVAISVLGFSQGAATASRWVFQSPKRFHQLVLWAGLLPPDLEIKPSNEIHSLKVVEVFGKQDIYLNDERFAEMIALNERFNIKAEVLSFEGGHELHTPTLENIMAH